jgi:hypothetical protein
VPNPGSLKKHGQGTQIKRADFEHDNMLFSNQKQNDREDKIIQRTMPGCRRLRESNRMLNSSESQFFFPLARSPTLGS